MNWRPLLSHLGITTISWTPQELVVPDQPTELFGRFIPYVDRYFFKCKYLSYSDIYKNSSSLKWESAKLIEQDAPSRGLQCRKTRRPDCGLQNNQGNTQRVPTLY